jgi:pyruvate carboxylase
MSYVLPPSVYFREGGFEIGEKIAFRDHDGKEHLIEVGPSPVNDTGETSVYLTVDHHQSVFSFPPERKAGEEDQQVTLSKEEIIDLARAGDIRAPFSATVVEIAVKEGQEIIAGDRVALLEAMKMQTPVLSETDGIVTAIYTSSGKKLKAGDKVLKIDADQEE